MDVDCYSDCFGIFFVLSLKRLLVVWLLSQLTCIFLDVGGDDGCGGSPYKICYHRIIMITMAGRVIKTCRTKFLECCWQLWVFHVLFFPGDGWICISTHLQMLFEILISTGHFSWRLSPVSTLKLFPLSLLQLFTITMGWWIVSRSFQIRRAPKDESRDVRNILSLL